MDLFSRIRLQSHRFTPAQERIVNYLQYNAHKALTLPINKLAEYCQVGDATIIRFCRLLGYDSYPAFRIALAKELADEEIRPIYEEVQKQDTLSDVIRKVIDSSIQGIKDLEKQIFPQSLEKIAKHFHRASVIHVVGLGASGVVAQDAMHKLMRLGFKMNAYTDSHLMTIAASIAEPEEIVFAISHSGETTEILNTVALAKKQGCFTCALTSSSESTITSAVDAYLLSSTRETKMRSDAMISRIVQLVVIDILYVMLALQIGEPATARIHQSRLALKQYRK